MCTWCYSNGKLLAVFQFIQGSRLNAPTMCAQIAIYFFLSQYLMKGKLSIQNVHFFLRSFANSPCVNPTHVLPNFFSVITIDERQTTVRVRSPLVSDFHVLCVFSKFYCQKSKFEKTRIFYWVFICLFVQNLYKLESFTECGIFW